MPIIRCPHCAQVTCVGPEVDDFVHECNSGKAALDNDSITRLESNVGPKETVSTSNSWLQGIADKASVSAKILGQKVYSIDDQGQRTSTHFQRQHYEFIQVGKK